FLLIISIDIVAVVLSFLSRHSLRLQIRDQHQLFEYLLIINQISLCVPNQRLLLSVHHILPEIVRAINESRRPQFMDERLPLRGESRMSGAVFQ
ncbi:hypothetical protein PFISCL1PPCAC_28036, partial [Pristionchus fissidentatus]